MAPEDDEYLTLAEAAEMLGMPPHTVERWAAEGRLPSELRSDGSRRFRRSELRRRSVRIDEQQEEDGEEEG